MVAAGHNNILVAALSHSTAILPQFHLNITSPTILRLSSFSPPWPAIWPAAPQLRQTIPYMSALMVLTYILSPQATIESIFSLPKRSLSFKYTAPQHTTSRIEKTPPRDVGQEVAAQPQDPGHLQLSQHSSSLSTKEDLQKGTCKQASHVIKNS